MARYAASSSQSRSSSTARTLRGAAVDRLLRDFDDLILLQMTGRVGADAAFVNMKATAEPLGRAPFSERDKLQEMS